MVVRGSVLASALSPLSLAPVPCSCSCSISSITIMSTSTIRIGSRVHGLSTAEQLREIRLIRGNFQKRSITSMSTSTIRREEEEWIKTDLHIHTLDDPKDVIDYSAHQLLERARQLGFGVLAITLHDAVFDRPEVFADAAAMGILLIPAAEVRLQGADAILVNVTSAEVAGLKNFDDLRQLRARRGLSIFTIAPHPFYVLGGSIGERLLDEIGCFDAIELCHFHKGLLNPNRRAAKVAAGVDC